MQTNVSDFGLPNTRRQSCNDTLSRTGPGQTRLKLYTLFRTEGPKTIPYPAARPRIAHIGEYPPPGTFTSDEGSEWLKELWCELYVEFRDDWSFGRELTAILLLGHLPSLALPLTNLLGISLSIGRKTANLKLTESG